MGDGVGLDLVHLEMGGDDGIELAHRHGGIRDGIDQDLVFLEIKSYKTDLGRSRACGRDPALGGDTQGPRVFSEDEGMEGRGKVGGDVQGRRISGLVSEDPDDLGFSLLITGGGVLMGPIGDESEFGVTDGGGDGL